MVMCRLRDSQSSNFILDAIAIWKNEHVQKIKSV